MALSFSEKRALQKTIADNLSKIASGKLTFSDKRSSQSEVIVCLKKLGESVSVPEAEQNLFQQIANGIHDALGAIGVFTKIKAEVDRLSREVISGDSLLDAALKAACIKCADLAEIEGVA